jgi:hypothetical protein
MKQLSVTMNKFYHYSALIMATVSMLCLGFLSFFVDDVAPKANALLMLGLIYLLLRTQPIDKTNHDM